MKTQIPGVDAYQEMREALRSLLAGFDSAYWQKVDHERGYPEAFVNALTEAGWLAALIPAEYGGSGLGLAEASVIMEEINFSGGNAGSCHGQMYNMGKNLINSSLKSQSGDGVQKLGRDAVASWLNFLAGNPIGASSDTASPKHFIEDAVNWLQTWGGKAGVNSPGNLADNVKTETFDIYDAAHTAVKTNTPQWNISQFAGDNHSAAQVHGALDYYNNTGQTSPTSVQYAMSADDSSDVMLIMASQVTV